MQRQVVGEGWFEGRWHTVRDAHRGVEGRLLSRVRGEVAEVVGAQGLADGGVGEGLRVGVVRRGEEGGHGFVARQARVEGRFDPVPVGGGGEGGGHVVGGESVGGAFGEVAGGGEVTQDADCGGGQCCDIILFLMEEREGRGGMP